MKAIAYSQYGPPDVLKLIEVEKPEPKDNEVLIKVRAAAVNDYDWAMVRGKPYAYRLLFGLRKPKHTTLGMELAGTVEAVGAEVTTFKVGDDVYGDISNHGFGAFAEYLCINEKAIVHKPANMSFTEAASIPHASMLAAQGLIDEGRIQQGQKVLINGGGGGVGTFALQIAKQYGAEVTGVDTGEKLEMMKTLGYDHVIDYRKEDFTRNGQRYDLILDAKTNRSPFAYVRALTPGGSYITVGGELHRILQLQCYRPLVSALHQRKMKLVALKPNKDLSFINELFEGSKIKCIIDGPYSIAEVPQAVQRFGEGKHIGKVVISIA